MAGIKDYSPVPASNTALFPEGMAPSAVNDGMRQVQADIRTEVASKGADIASAETVDLGAATGDFVDITGTTTIVSLGTVSAGIRRTVRFRGALTLTHNATSLILPGGANITTADGDIARFRSLESGNWVCEGYSRADGTAVNDGNYAKLDTANIFAEDLTIRSDDAGTSLEPTLTFNRNNTSPAASDSVGSLVLSGRNAADEAMIYGRLRSQIDDPTDGSEDGRLIFDTAQAGDTSVRMQLAAGLFMTGATGDDPGAGKINATAYEANGAALPFQKAYESGQQGITSGGTLTLAHSLGSQPKLYMVFLKCVSAEHGYHVGDEVNVLNLQGTHQGVTIVPDATNLNIQYGQAAAPFNVINTSGQAVSATSSRWRAIFRAWA
ncbi:hypothetical protein [Rhodospirillaceae bacterium SYSU D60014]|uniref:hypothetical protein n=1 Tax=Virgifigura deserti TaxID=2268457 RepID=UPI000E668842